MGQSVVKNPKKLYSQLGGDPTLPTRVTTLENNEYKITYYEVVSGASGSLTLPTGATINAGEFGLSGNCVLSKIDGSNKPTFESPKTAGGTVVTASLNETTGAWVASGVYTDPSVALIYSIKIKAVYYSNLTYSNIIETVDVGGGGLSGLTTNKVLKATSSTTAGNSNITDDGTSITISSPNNQNLVVVEDNNLYIQYLGTTNAGGLTYLNTYVDLQHDVRVNLNAPSVTKNGVEVATVNDIPPYPTTYDLFITTGNQTTTSNVASNITDLVSPILNANKRYKISGVIRFGCNNSGGVKYQITVPSGATLWIMGHSNLTNANTITWTPVLSSATLSPSFAGVVSADYGALCIYGEISIGATAGVIQFGFASATNTQTSTVYQLGTQLTLTQIN